MAEKIELAADEVIIQKSENIKYGGRFATFNDDLILTNKNIIYVKKGAFGKIKNITHFPIDQIKVYNDQAQATLGKMSDGAAALEIGFISGQELFGFQSKKDIKIWIEKINELVTGKKTTTINSGFHFAIPGTEKVAKTIKGTLDTYKDVFGLKKKEEHVSINCESCGASVAGIKGETIQCPYCGKYITL